MNCNTAAHRKSSLSLGYRKGLIEKIEIKDGDFYILTGIGISKKITHLYYYIDFSIKSNENNTTTTMLFFILDRHKAYLFLRAVKFLNSRKSIATELSPYDILKIEKIKNDIFLLGLKNKSLGDNALTISKKTFMFIIDQIKQFYENYYIIFSNIRSSFKED